VHTASDLDSGLALLEAGGDSWHSLDIVQVRGKSMPTGDLEKLVKRWTESVSGSTTLIVVNDRVDVALATDAHGAHVGRGDLPVGAIRELAPRRFVIGISTHDEREVAHARESGADYAGLGAFYTSHTKPEAFLLDRGSRGLGEAVRGASIPVLAIGGITAERVRDVCSSVPVNGVAVSDAIQGAADPCVAIAELRSELDQAWMDRKLHEVEG
jgi:thiamine-phosphate pyrophosphorylase